MNYKIRIPLETYAYLEIDADTLPEIQKAEAEAKVLYAERIFKDKAPLAHANTPTQFAQTLEAPMCKDCGSVMAYREGITKSGKNAGKPWKGWFCPNGTKENRFEHVTVWVK